MKDSRCCCISKCIKCHNLMRQNSKHVLSSKTFFRGRLADKCDWQRTDYMNLGTRNKYLIFYNYNLSYENTVICMFVSLYY